MYFELEKNFFNIIFFPVKSTNQLHLHPYFLKFEFGLKMPLCNIEYISMRYAQHYSVEVSDQIPISKVTDSFYLYTYVT